MAPAHGRASGCALSVQTSSRSSCAHASTVRSPRRTAISRNAFARCQYPSQRMDQLSALLTCRSKIGKLRPYAFEGNAWPTRRNRAKLCDARSKSTTSSQIMISTPIDIAATAAARHPFAQAALGQSDWSATSTRYNGRHRSTRTAGSLSRRRDQNWRTSNGRKVNG